MIINISGSTFREIFDDVELHLPLRWNGSDFYVTLKGLLDRYMQRLYEFCYTKGGSDNDVKVDYNGIKQVCRVLVDAVRYYYDGFPSEAFYSFECAMSILMRNPLKIYKSVMEQFDDFNDAYRKNDKLRLFRVVSVDDNKPYSRERVFHTPYTLRSKVSTSRYSIAGYPSLYLGTTLALCCEEIGEKVKNKFALASMFKIEESLAQSQAEIEIIELGIKPQDFLGQDHRNESRRRYVPSELTRDSAIQSAYLLWYPLIASCSFIRTNKEDPFASEYIIPQLLMQWVRRYYADFRNCEGYSQLVGIRYFSCASVRASDMGYNYVFPTSGQQKSDKLPYCNMLCKAFQLTNPTYIHEYDDLRACERYLFSENFHFIDDT